MKYRGMKEVYICLGVMFSFLTVDGAVAAFTRWNDCDAGVNALMLVMLCISVIGAVYFLSCLRQPPVRTEFRADGIHVLSKEGGELASIDWNDVKDFRYVTPDVSATKIVYALLILQRAASFGGKSISMFRKHRLSDAGRIAENSLDELAAKLAAGTMSAEEFKSVPFIFAVSESSYYKSGFFQPDRTVEKLWRARRMECRAAEGGAEDSQE